MTGLTSLVGSCPITEISSHPRLTRAPASFAPSDSVRRLEWFTDGFFSYYHRNDVLGITDLRIGFHPGFVFSFAFARQEVGRFLAIEPVQTALGGPRSELIQDIITRATNSVATCRG